MRTTLLWVSLLTLGCGKKDDGASQQPAPSADKPSAPAAAAPPADPPPAAPAPPAETPECKIEVTGGKTRTWRGSGGISAASTSYWLEGDDRNKKMLYGEKSGLLLNCTAGRNDSLSIGMQNGKADSVPLGPKKFTLGPDRSKNELGVLATIDTESLMRAEGTIEITAFDRSHIAGKLEITGKLLPSEGIVKIVGEFDFKCPKLAGCAK